MKRFIFFIFILILFVSCSNLKQYEEQAIKWEDAIQKFEQRDKSEVDPDNAILFVGSSSIRLWDSIHVDMKPYQVIQRGYGGARFSDLAWYADRIIYPHEFDALVIFVANDISGSERDKTPEEVFRLYKHVIKTVRKKNPDKPIFYIGITPCNSRWGVWDKINQGNDLIKNYCEKNDNLFYIATADKFIGEDQIPDSTLFRSDQLHLNLDGYQLWANIIKKELDKVLK